MAHLYAANSEGAIPEEPEDEKPILHIGGISAVYPDTFPKQLQYVALGHLHRHHTVCESPCPIVYSGTPLAYSFSETNQKKYVMLVEVEPGQPASVRPIELSQGRRLLRMEFAELDEAIDWLKAHPDTFVELTLVSDTYIDAKAKKLLYDAHAGIVSIIPKITPTNQPSSDRPKIDLKDNIQTLFSNYFERKRGQVPHEGLMTLLNEVIEAEEN